MKCSFHPRIFKRATVESDELDQLRKEKRPCTRQPPESLAAPGHASVGKTVACAVGTQGVYGCFAHTQTSDYRAIRAFNDLSIHPPTHPSISFYFCLSHVGIRGYVAVSIISCSLQEDSRGPCSDSRGPCSVLAGSF